MPRWVPSLIVGAVVGTFTLGCFVPCECDDSVTIGDDQGPNAWVCPLTAVDGESAGDPAPPTDPEEAPALGLYGAGLLDPSGPSGCELDQATDENGEIAVNAVILTASGFQDDESVLVEWHLSIGSYANSGTHEVWLVAGDTGEPARLELGLAIPGDAEGPLDLVVSVVDFDGREAELFLDFVVR